MAKGLGKGLQAFFPEQNDDIQEKIEQIAISQLRANPYQPRKTFTEEAISELADSIAEHGILQPIVARKSIKGYEIVVGERRFRAAQKAGVKEVPVIVKELDEQKMMELALIENLQREDLNPIEEATAYAKLMDHLSITQEKLAVRLGKSRPHIANHLRLLNLPRMVQEFISDGKLSMGHGRALLGLKEKQKLSLLVEKIIKEHLSVREVEDLVNQLNERVPKETKRKKVTLSPFLQERQDVLRSRLGTAVSIKPGKKKGKIEIDYFSEEDLERIIQLLHSEDAL
ncbi:chromosome (plasmid) partitioning protein ParB [Halalkalibacter wakoensis JCM 9140]|uniref:Chromosome (Plasmid) partitioning protein ParB n=1 Tax=Halalkalibacter wakoensis JCM 9140 TaxID=1236970 RepID=W4Q4B1_9BACI|nr:ParB/RepB/Spo0J family partition protein [Halalkalibacter wakoensis]GAE26209.1 chromosome (plasmid) partitioning protein ParB [Halalkalibacter wakoensis JCM 9140]